MKVDKLPKYFQIRLKKISFPVIIKFDDHHQEFMHYAEDADELGDVFLHVLRNRIDSYFSFYEDSDIREDDDILTLEEIEKLPKQYKEDAMRKYNNHQSNLNGKNENNKIYAMCKKALKDKDGGLAWECMDSHSQYDDEEFNIISVKDLRV